MKQQEMIEAVQQHHPMIGETQIRLWLNEAIREFCRKTRCIKAVYQFDTTTDTRWYGLEDEILEVTDVDFDGYRIPRLVGTPEKKDLT